MALYLDIVERQLQGDLEVMMVMSKITGISQGFTQLVVRLTLCCEPAVALTTC